MRVGVTVRPNAPAALRTRGKTNPASGAVRDIEANRSLRCPIGSPNVAFNDEAGLQVSGTPRFAVAVGGCLPDGVGFERPVSRIACPSSVRSGRQVRQTGGPADGRQIGRGLSRVGRAKYGEFVAD